LVYLTIPCPNIRGVDQNKLVSLKTLELSSCQFFFDASRLRTRQAKIGRNIWHLRVSIKLVLKKLDRSCICLLCGWLPLSGFF
jgi:hypothetical protein